MSSSVRLSVDEAEVLASLMMFAISELLLSISRVNASPLVSIACRLSLVTRSMSVANCMLANEIRHVPLTTDGVVHAIVSERDVLRALVEGAAGAEQ